jgi:hypothetical protein
MIDPSQAEPIRVVEKRTEGLKRTDLGPLIWGLVFVLFLLERMIAFRYGERKT